LLVFAVVMAASPAQAEKHITLLIGNGSYANEAGQCANPQVGTAKTTTQDD
jgi:hypothetical protein